MFGAIDDDDFFTPTTSSNLATLFGAAVIAPTKSSTDLTYSAPKQPKPSSDEYSKMKALKLKDQSAVLCAKPVNLYKLNNETYTSLGKYGLALIGNALLANEVLLYKDKRNILTRTKIHPDFEFFIENNKFLCFIDDNKKVWSMSFDIVKDLNDFIHEVQIRNINVANRKTDMCIQTDNSNRTSIVDSSPIIIEDAEASSDSPSSQTRADILTRMAKMGQSILPNAVIKSRLASDSETDDGASDRKVVSRKPKTKRDLNTTIDVEEKHVCDNKVVPNTQLTTQQYTLINGQLIPMATTPMYPHYTQSLPSNVIMNPTPHTGDNLGLLLTENRMHNSEVRMNLSMITSKLDNVLGEIAKIKNPTNTDQLENDFLKSKLNDLEIKNAYLIKSLEEKEDAFNKSTKLAEEIKLKDETIHQLEQQILYESQELKSQIERLKWKEEEMSKTIETQQLKLNDLELFYENNKNNQNMQKIIDGLNDELVQLNLASKEAQAKRIEMEEAMTKTFNNDIKQSMNTMYKRILKDCSEASQGSSIQSILASSMKVATYDIIQHFKDCLYKDSTSDVPPPVPVFEN